MSDLILMWLINPDAAYVYIAAIVLAWVGYCLYSGVRKRRGERQ